MKDFTRKYRTFRDTVSYHKLLNKKAIWGFYRQSTKNKWEKQAGNQGKFQRNPRGNNQRKSLGNQIPI